MLKSKFPAILVALPLVALALARPATAQDRNCDDFDGWLAAQAFYLAEGGPEADPNGLDADGNGYACEGLPIIRTRQLLQGYQYDTEETVRRITCATVETPFTLEDLIRQAERVLAGNGDPSPNGRFLAMAECIATIGGQMP